MCSYKIISRYAVANLAARTRLSLSSVALIARPEYKSIKVKSRSPAASCEIMARAEYDPVKESSDFYQIILTDGDGTILLDDLGNAIIIGYCYA